jgi:hypothetical protein
MRSKVILTLAVSIFALTLAAVPHHAAAQSPFAASTETQFLTLPQGGLGTINAIELPKAGTYVITGQQDFIGYPSSAETPVLCYMTTQPGSATALPTGPYSMSTIEPPGGYVTIPLNGYYTAASAMTLWLECRYWGQQQVSTFYGTLTATEVK